MVVSFVLLAAVPGVSSAKEFHLYGCRDAIGAPAPLDGWAPGSNLGIDPYYSPGYAWGPIGSVKQDNACGSGGPYRLYNGAAAGGTPGGVETNAWVGFTPGAGLTVKRATLYRAMITSTSAAWSGTSAVASSWTRLGSPLFSGGNVEAPLQSPAVSVGDFDTPLAEANKLTIPSFGDKNLYAGTSCYGQRQGYVGECDARYWLYASDVVLDDAIGPTGGVVGDSPGGAVSGSVTMEVQGADQGSGLRRAIVEVDGKELVRADTRAAGKAPNCAPTTAADGLPGYTYRQPCPTTANIPLIWDSASVANGVRAYRLLVEDAAGNKTVVAAGNFTVSNSVTTSGATGVTSGGASSGPAKVGPGTALAERGAPNGDSEEDAGTLALVWSSTAKAPSKKPSVQRRCSKQPAWAAKNTAKCQGVTARSDIEVPWSVSKTDDLSGRLTTAAGVPVRNASISLTVTPTMAGAATVPLGVATTGDSGEFTAKVPRTYGSATVEARWMARQNDTVPSAAVVATTSVRGVVTLAPIAPIRAGSRVTFRGTIPTLGLPGDGRRIALQYLRGNAWTTFAEPRVAANGKWSFARLFRGTGSYRVRVLMRALPGLPFATSSSAPRALRIR